MGTPLPPTELGQLLTGKDALHNSIQINKLLEERTYVLLAKLRTGLTKEEYTQYNNELMAVYSAQMIVKSIHIFNAQYA